jgi:hypothetical protein
VVDTEISRFFPYSVSPYGTIDLIGHHSILFGIRTSVISAEFEV